MWFTYPYRFWNPESNAIPSLYWDVFSSEQRSHAMCKEMGKLIAYNEYQTERINENRKDIDTLEPANIESIENAILNIVSVLNFEGVTNDGADITDALQDAIDSIPEYSYVRFPYGEYLFETLTLKDNCIYDFCDSTVTVSGIQGIKISGELVKSRTIGALNANQKVISNSVPNVEKGQLLRFINTSELAHKGRTYYYKGFNAIAEQVKDDNVYLNASVPYAIGAACIVQVYNPCRVTIKNIGKLSSSYTATNSYPIYVTEGYNCLFDNIKLDCSDSNGICISHCVCTTFNRITGTVTTPVNSFNYNIQILSCSHTYVGNCDIASQWHCVTTGGNETTLYTTVENSKLTEFGTTAAYVDHENTLYTKLDKVVTDGFRIVGEIVNSTIYAKNTMGFSPWNANDDFEVCRVENCEFIMTNNIPLALGFTPQTSGGNEWRIERVLIVNCNITGDYDLRISQTSTGQAITHVGTCLIDNTNAMKDLAYSLSNLVEKLILKNTTFTAKSARSFRNSAMETFIENCVFVPTEEFAFMMELNNMTFINGLYIDCKNLGDTLASSASKIIARNGSTVVVNNMIASKYVGPYGNYYLFLRDTNSKVIFNNVMNIAIRDVNTIPIYGNNILNNGELYAYTNHNSTSIKYVYDDTGLTVVS